MQCARSAPPPWDPGGISSTVPSARTRRERLAALERPLLLAGLALVTVHLLDLALSGPDTTVAGIAAILALPVLAAALQPRVSRVTRFALAVPLGLVCAGFGAAAHVLDLVTSGPRWTDLTGVAFAAGGLLIAAAGIAAAAGPRAMPARPRTVARRALHAAGWVAGAVVIAQLVVLPAVTAILTTHAARLPVDGGALGVAHETVAIPFGDGDRLAGWYVPSRNRAAVLVVHGSGGNRSRVARQARLVARDGYGMLAIDLPGHGDSDGRANLLGYNAQPAIRAAVGWLARRPDVDPARIAGFGMSLGGEVLVEAAARDPRLRAVVSDGAQRASDDRELGVGSSFGRVVSSISLQAVRGVSGTREAPPLVELVGRIAPRRVLLVAAGGRPDEIRVNRAYRRAAGPTAELWTIPEAGHTQGVKARPGEYARRVLTFLAGALGVRSASVHGPY